MPAIIDDLRAEHKDMAADLKDLVTEHEEIAIKVAALRQIVDRVLEEEEVSRDVLLSRGKDVLSTHWTHMREEEDRFFPLSERCLATEDWAEIYLAASIRCSRLRTLPISTVCAGVSLPSEGLLRCGHEKGATAFCRAPLSLCYL